MDLRLLDDSYKSSYNKVVTHVMQSWEWGEFRKSLGLPLLRYGIFKKGQLTTAFQLTLHKIPYTSQYVGYLPKGPLPNKELAQALEKVGKENNCAFIKVEPNILSSTPLYSVYPQFLPSPKPLFTKYNFLLDLTSSEEDLLKQMHQKTRYNIRLAQKKGVTIQIRDDDEAFEIFQKLHFDTTKRQGFHSHNKTYHKKAWETLKKANLAKIALAFYNPKHSESNSPINPKSIKNTPSPTSNLQPPTSTTEIPLASWMLYTFHDTLYYPYGGSSTEYKEVMANNLLAWEVILYGKSKNLKSFDMWGALSPNPNPKDPWIGFHRFKSGYGGKLVEYIGTFDLVFNDPLYWAFTTIDKFSKLKFALLKLTNK